MRVSGLWFLSILLLFSSWSLQGQTRLPIRSISGKIVRSTDSLAIENALVRLGSHYTFSNDSGYFELNAVADDKQIEIFHPGYLRLTKKVKANGVNLGFVFLKPDKDTLQEVLVQSKTDQFFGGVKDFQWLGNRLLVSHYKGRKHWFDVRENTGEMDKVAIFRDKLEMEDLLKDCYGRIYGLHKETVTRILLNNDTVVLGNSMPLKDFLPFYSRCALSDNHLQVYKYFIGHKKGLVYTLANTETEEEKRLYCQLDTVKFIKTDNIYKRWAEKAGYQALAMGDIGLSQLAKSRLAFDLMSFYKAMLKPEVYIPVFKVQNQWWIFDHVLGKVLAFNPGDTVANSVSDISFHLSENWGKEIIQALNGQFYIKFQTIGGKTFLQHFNAETKMVDGAMVELKNSFPKKILVADNRVIYTFKNTEGFYQLSIEPLVVNLAAQ